MTNFPRATTLEEQQLNEERLLRQQQRQVPMRRQLTNLALIISAIVIPFVVTGRAGILLVIGCLAFFIMFHEFGHFIVAKACGMKVTEFFIGFGPRLFSVRRGETEYGFKAFPLGGYVKIVGMTAEEAVPAVDELRTYRRQRWYKRVATILAGPATHFVMAFVLLVVIFGFSGRPEISNEIGALEKGYAAEKAGIAVGDKIVSVQGTPVTNWFGVVDRLAAEPAPEVTLGVIDAAGNTRTVTVVRTIETLPDSAPRAVLGIRPAREIYVKESFPTSVSMAGSTLVDYSKTTVKGMGQFFSPSSISSFFKQVTGAHSNKKEITDAELQSRPTSIVGMTQIGAQAAKSGTSQLLEILVIINLALGSFNLLPMLPLDGGHIVVATYESIVGKFTGRRHFLNMERVMPVVFAFFGFILLLGLGSIYLDIVKPVS
jgi:membrane-associated protease RseP (regulator of RpoE activity)